MISSKCIIEQAKKLYPVSYYYKGQLADKQYNEIEKQCEIHCSSTYMNGTRIYCIRYKMNEEQTTDEQ